MCAPVEVFDGPLKTGGPRGLFVRALVPICVFVLGVFRRLGWLLIKPIWLCLWLDLGFVVISSSFFSGFVQLCEVIGMEWIPWLVGMVAVSCTARRYGESRCSLLMKFSFLVGVAYFCNYFCPAVFLIFFLLWLLGDGRCRRTDIRCIAVNKKKKKPVLLCCGCWAVSRRSFGSRNPVGKIIVQPFGLYLCVFFFLSPAGNERLFSVIGFGDLRTHITNLQLSNSSAPTNHLIGSSYF